MATRPERLERLTSQDMSSLLAERGPIHVHVGGTAIFAGEPPPFDQLLEHVDQRLRLIPRFRQKIRHDPARLANPVWVNDAEFDLRWHVRRLGLPSPGGMADLRELVGQIMSEPLDMSRPLWQIYVIEGLEGGRFAAISKTHHALVDGVSALDVGAVILDTDPEGTEIEAPDVDWDPQEPRADRLLRYALTHRMRTPVAAMRRAALRSLNPRETAARTLKTAQAFAKLAASGPSAPRTFLNVEIGRDRRVAFVSADLDQFKAMREGIGATVNDVVLSVCAGALRRLFEHRRARVPAELVALVPMNVRKPHEEGELGNRLATMLAPIPLGEPDPVKRLLKVHETTTQIKGSEAAIAASMIIEAVGWTPPTMNRVLAGAMSRPLTWNLVISNVPGPPFPVYLLGRELLAMHPFVALSPQGHALAIGVVSYNGKLNFGLVGDRDKLADLDLLADFLAEEIAAQQVAA